MKRGILFIVFLLLAAVYRADKDAHGQFATAPPTFSVPTAETPADSLHLIAPREQAIVRQGPGHTHLQVNQLDWQDTITILERNRAGNWLHIRVQRGAGVVIDGWVMTGHLILDEAVHLSEVPVNANIPDANPSTVNSRSMARLYSVPVIPSVSGAMQEIFVRGQQLGNYRNVITKIGDSLSVSRIYLTSMSRGDHELGPYDFLEETIVYFGASMAEPSVASRIGLSSIAVFDPVWADAQLCESNESPLACEYRRKKPSVAFILFGPNDVRSMDDDRYGMQMRMIVEESLTAGVIPVLSTFSVDPDDEFWWQAINFNLVLVDIAAEYEVPIINLWSAARPLPDYGLDEDGVHLKHSGYENLYYATGHEAYYGVSLQNLLSLCMLDELRRAMEMG